MKVELAQVSDVERRMTVEVPPDIVSAEIENAYRELKKTVKLRGFRPGKAPLSILQRHFKAQVEEDVIGKIVQQTYPEALGEVSATPVSQPKIENGVLEQGREFAYTAVFEIKPEIDVKDYDGIQIKPADPVVGDDEIEKQLSILRNNCATMRDVDDRPCRENDHVLFDFEGTVEGRPFGGGKKTDFFLELTENAFLPGFTAQLQGLKPGEEKAFSLTLPEDYFEADNAGKCIDFTVVMKSIQEKILPEPSDEFAREAGDYADLADLKQKIRQRLLENKKQQADEAVRNAIIDALIEKNPFAVPRSMVEMQARNMVLEMQQMLKAQGMRIEDLGATPAQLFEQYREPAERQVRSALLLVEVARKEGLSVSDEEIEGKLEEIALQVNQDVAAIRARISPDMLRPQILEKKALDLIKARATIAET